MSFYLTKRTCLNGLAFGLLQTQGLLVYAQNPVSSNSFWEKPRLIRVGFQFGSKSIFKEVLYWKNGQYDDAAHLLLSQLCLDQKALKAVQMDPRLFDLIYATQYWFRLLMGYETHHLITSAFRTESTNHQVGGALHSQHLLGKALDGRIAGLDLNTYAQMLLSFKAGGVGLYATHVHWDVGRSSRFWQA
jgi:uncharacterized protein YcbK (DUF882 family)